MDIFVPSPYLSVRPGYSIDLGSGSRGFVPLGHPFHSEGFGAPWKIDYLTHYLEIPFEV